MSKLQTVESSLQLMVEFSFPQKAKNVGCLVPLDANNLQEEGDGSLG